MTISTEHRPQTNHAPDQPPQIHLRLRRGKPVGAFRTAGDAKHAAERAASIRGAGRWREAPCLGTREHELVETDVHGPCPESDRVYVLVDYQGRFKSVHGTRNAESRTITDRFVCLRIQEPKAAAAA